MMWPDVHHWSQTCPVSQIHAFRNCYGNGDWELWFTADDDPLFELSVDVDYNHDKSSSQRGVVNPSLVDTACSALSGPQPPQTGPEKRCSLFQSRPATSVDGEPDGIVAAILVDTLPGKISQLRVCCLVSWKRYTNRLSPGLHNY